MEWDLSKAIEMWNDGKSALEIAKHFDVTRNSVTGKIHRARKNDNKIIRKAPTVQRKPKYLIGKKVRLPVKKAVPPIDEVLVIIAEPFKKDRKVENKLGFLIYELVPGQCKYAVSESTSGEHLFCGADTAKVYCEEHHKICHSRPEKKEQVSRKEYKRNNFLNYR